ncbi:hypothetical protein L1987_06606 [Smallanthus sonchifolius]|uniref:Uncharacterized protein n=1 Tax=Smallanthus sonchifolius TaxID=185202 RepID=A0ACB9JYT6_9ASTR|nr:hypothetical protein L1987_06606 [Smallanthus sonchifolius]
MILLHSYDVINAIEDYRSILKDTERNQQVDAGAVEVVIDDVHSSGVGFERAIRRRRRLWSTAATVAVVVDDSGSAHSVRGFNDRPWFQPINTGGSMVARGRPSGYLCTSLTATQFETLTRCFAEI